MAKNKRPEGSGHYIEAQFFSCTPTRLADGFGLEIALRTRCLSPDVKLARDSTCGAVL
ncbi:MAG: hypothetical protein HQP61_04480 [Peptococcaceae bacterium]|nr:hypothetical protein [Candidatus Syntrophopropionicum ammoniitolerans]